MRRIEVSPRPGWRETVRGQGLVYTDTHLPDGSVMSYWNENACYEFAADEVERLENATEELHRMCLAAARHVVMHGRFAEFGIPEWAAGAVARSLDAAPPSVYGRFDLWYDGVGDPKMLEYNADTPTGLVEAAITQWYWLMDTRPQDDQWNSIHEHLVEAWRAIAPRLAGNLVHFAWSDEETSGEDLMTVGYLAETAHQAGLLTELVPVDEMGWDGLRFVNVLNTPISTCFKLYPWEWMLGEPFGKLAIDPRTPITWIEPAWKLLLSNKALLAVLWELYPGHQYLLPAYLDGPRDMREYVAKPLYGREGASVRIVTTTGEVANPGEYGAEGFCYQEFRALPSFAGNRMVLGSWVVPDGGSSTGEGISVGAGIRESDGLITDGYARFVPNVIPTATGLT